VSSIVSSISWPNTPIIPSLSPSLSHVSLSLSLAQSTNDPDMGWREITLPQGLQHPNDRLQLVGHSVDTCMSLAFSAIQFKCLQDELYARLRYEKLQQKLQATEQHFRKKIAMMNQGYEDMKEQVNAMRREKQEMEGDIRELRDKYGQKAKEAQSLRQQISSSHGQPGPAGGYVRDSGGSQGKPQVMHAPQMQGLQLAHHHHNPRHSSPSALMPRSRSPHHGRRPRSPAYDNRYGSPYATPSRSSPSMLIASVQRHPHRTSPAQGTMHGSGGLVGLSMSR
jgi:hypothetical protein